MTPNKRIIPWIVASLFFIEVLDETIISTSIPKMAVSLGVNPISLKAAIISYLVSLAIIIPISGWFAARFGTRRIILIAVSIFLLGSICCGLSANLDWLILSRILQGMGGAFIAPIGRMVMLHTYEKHELVKAMNFVIIPGLVGSLSGPVLGGLIVTFFSWRYIFFINVPVCLAALFFIAKYMPDYKNTDHKKQFDWLGFVLLGTGLGGGSFVMEGFGEHFLSSSVTFMLLAVFVLCVVGCYVFSRHKTHPVINFKLFRLHSFGVAASATLFIRISIACAFFLLPLMYQIIFGWTPLLSGLMVTPLIIGSMTMKVFVQRVLKRYGMRRVLIIDSLLIVLSVMGYACVTRQTSLIFIIALSFLLGAFMSTFFTACNATAYSELNTSTKMEGISIYSTIQRVSVCIGIGVTALVLQQFLDGSMLDKLSQPAVFHHTFIVVACVGLIAPLLFLTYPADIGAEMSGHQRKVN